MAFHRRFVGPLIALGLIGLAACRAGEAPVSGGPSPSSSPAELERVDVFGSAILDRGTLLARHGEALAEVLRRPDDVAARAEVKRALIAEGGFAFVDLALVTYYGPERTYLTVDLVDAGDERRMTFGSPPTEQLPDPDGLIELWREYEAKFFAALESGATLGEPSKCRFWHCLGFETPELSPYADRFAARVPASADSLAQILSGDARPDHRAAAAFLLAHLPDGARVVELMLPAIRDPEPRVRNNAMRVLAMAAMKDPEIGIPLQPIIAALGYPTTTDRNKAAAILAPLSRLERNRAAIRAGAGELLVQMLALRQPNNHDFAYQILKNLSGRDLGEHDVAAWRAWLRRP